MTERDESPEARFALDWPDAPRTPGAPDGPPPPEMRLRWHERADPAAGGTDDPHAACRQEIERLESLVAELRRELSTLRRRAQLRAR